MTKRYKIIYNANPSNKLCDHWHPYAMVDTLNNVHCAARYRDLAEAQKQADHLNREIKLSKEMKEAGKLAWKSFKEAPLLNKYFVVAAAIQIAPAVVLLGGFGLAAFGVGKTVEKITGKTL